MSADSRVYAQAVIFTSTELADVFLIETHPHRDERGSFARTFDERLFEEAGLVTHFPQHNLVVNEGKGILRGMHFQAPPHGEVKVIRCVEGAIHDVIIDLRRGSSTFGEWRGFGLADPNLALYVPVGFAHGYQTLSEHSVVTYLMGAEYQPGSEGGIRYDDGTLAIEWPISDPLLSDKDSGLPPFDPENTPFP